LSLFKDKNHNKTVYKLFGLPFFTRTRKKYGEWYSENRYSIFGIRFRRIDKGICLRAIAISMHQLLNKMSLPDNTVELPCGVKFYVPMYPADRIQCDLVEQRRFFEQDILDDLSRYIPDAAVIVDVGANIGNHSIYWAKIHNAKRVYSFEPVPLTYEILCENVRINGLEQIVITHRLGLGDRDDSAEITNFPVDNIGAARIGYAKNSHTATGLKITRLDNLDLGEDRIDFVKIDVEGFERQTLAGMENTLRKHMPAVLIESFYANIDFTKVFFKNLSYREPVPYAEENYLFLPNKPEHNDEGGISENTA
jgi:FkbM family methyltransferase